MKLFKQRGGAQSRLQAALLPAVLVLLAADVFVRLTPPAASASEAAAVQPETGPGGVPTLVNPARQRALMLDELKEMNRRVTSMERKLDGRLRVEVVNFPKAEASKGD